MLASQNHFGLGTLFPRSSAFREPATSTPKIIIVTKPNITIAKKRTDAGEMLFSIKRKSRNKKTKEVKKMKDRLKCTTTKENTQIISSKEKKKIKKQLMKELKSS